MKIGDCAWYADPAITIGTIKADWNKIHKIVDSRLEEDFAGIENDVFVAICGEEFESWCITGGLKSISGSLELAEQTGLKFCEKCF